MERNDVFSKIVRGEIPCYKIYEDTNFLAFLDINPLCEGHTLLIPKKYARWVWDIEKYSLFFETAKKIAKHFQKVTKNDLVMLKVIGTDIPYAHLHILPYDDNSSNKRKPSEKKLKEIQNKFSLN